MENNQFIENNQPTNPSPAMIGGKLAIGVLMGVISSLMVFLAFTGLAAANINLSNYFGADGQHPPFSPLVWLSFMGIAIVIAIFGTIIISIIYNAIWQDDYYDMKLMISGLLASNLLILVVFLFLYIYTGSVLNNLESVFLVYGFHLFFSIFISFIVMDILKNPNYSIVYVIGNSFGFIIALLIFFIIYNAYSNSGGDAVKNILFYPPILAYILIPLISTLWEKLYYKFYELGNDFLYVPSISEVLVDEEEVDEINVDV